MNGFHNFEKSLEVLVCRLKGNRRAMSPIVTYFTIICCLFSLVYGIYSGHAITDIQI